MVAAGRPPRGQERLAMKRLFEPLLVLSVALAAGCGIGPHVDDYLDALVAWEQTTCGCDSWKGTHDSEAQCRAERPPTAAEQACVEALFKNTPGDYEVQLDCAAAAYNRASACLGGKTCTDIARAACPFDLVGELADCPDLPNDVLQELNECLN
jgi:hypothetical protein